AVQAQYADGVVGLSRLELTNQRNGHEREIRRPPRRVGGWGVGGMVAPPETAFLRDMHRLQQPSLIGNARDAPLAIAGVIVADVKPYTTEVVLRHLVGNPGHEVVAFSPEEGAARDALDGFR